MVRLAHGHGGSLCPSGSVVLVQCMHIDQWSVAGQSIVCSVWQYGMSGLISYTHWGLAHVHTNYMLRHIM